MIGKLLIGLVVIVLGFMVGWYMLEGEELQLPGITGSVQKDTDSDSTGLPDRTYEYVQEEITGAPANKTGEEKGGTTPVSQNQESMQITYGDNGFSPAVLTVKVGSLVKFTNRSRKNMWVKSTTSAQLSGFDQLKSVSEDGVYSYTFAKVGTWKYLNKNVPDDAGTVIVTQ
ncbi:hypothetical protein ACFL1A_02125 [Patescibacteria group bacterium]